MAKMWHFLIFLKLYCDQTVWFFQLFSRAGASLNKAVKRKLRDTAEACSQQGLVFLPFAMETLGGLHSSAVTQAKQIAAALARSKGCEESETTSQLLGKLSLTLMRCNAMMLTSRHRDSDFVSPDVDGIMWMKIFISSLTFGNKRFHTKKSFLNSSEEILHVIF